MIRTKPYHHYSDYDLEPGGLRKLDFIVEKIEKSFAQNHNQISILDVGCGHGNISRPLAFLGYEVTGFDVQAKAIEDLNSKNPSGNLKTVVKSFEDYKTDEHFEVIIMSDFLEHAEKPEEVLKKARALLKINGILIITVPNGFTIEETMRKIFNVNSLTKSIKSNLKNRMLDKDVQSPSESPHLHFWPLMAYKNVIRLAGFNILEVKSSSFLFKEAYYLIGRFLLKRGSWLFHQFDKIDCALARFVPISLASGWLMVAKK